MVSIRNTFAGCNPTNKSTTISNNQLFYISASNMIIADYFGIKDVIFFENVLCAISSYKNLVLVGDVNGNCYVIKDNETKIFKIPIKVQDCCFLNENTALFATMNSFHIINLTTNVQFDFQLEYVIASIAVISDFILIGTNLGTLYAYKFLENQFIKVEEINAHSDSIKYIRSDKGSIFATCSQDNNIKVWVLEDKISLLQTLNGHSDWINYLFWEDNKLYSASSDKTIRVWEINSNKQKEDAENSYFVCSNIFGGSSEILGVFFLEGRLMAQYKTGGIDKLNDNEYYLTGHSKEVTDLDWKDDLLITCSLDRTTRIFYNGIEVARPQTHGFTLSSVKFLFSDKLRYISSGHETILRIYEATKLFFDTCSWAADRTSEDIDENLVLNESADYQYSAYQSELNLTNEIQTEEVCDDHSENLLSTNTFVEHKKIYGHFFEIKDIEVGKSYILSCNRSAVKKFAGLFLWNSNGEKLDYVESHDLGIQKIALSPDQKSVVTVGRDKQVFLYKIKNEKLEHIKAFNNHERIVFDCGFSRDSNMFATCSRDQKVILYDTNKEEVILEKEFSEEITSICFNPTNDIIAVGTVSGAIYLLDYSLNLIESQKVLGKKINILRFNDKGNLLAIGGSDGLTRILEL